MCPQYLCLRSRLGVRCTMGHFCLGGSHGKAECPLGTWGNSTGGTSAACDGKCLLGYYGATTGQTSSTCSGPCSASPGSYCPAGSDASTGVVCPPGSWCQGGASDKTPCPRGSYGSAPGLSTPACSDKCAGGYFGSATGQTTSACSGPCTVAAGQYCASGSTANTGAGARVACMQPPPLVSTAVLCALFAWALLLVCTCVLK